MIDQKSPEKGPMIWTMSWTMDKDIAKISVDKQTKEVYAIDDPEDGYDLSFDRTGKGINTRYSGYQLARRPTSIEQDWLDWVVMNPLDQCLVWRDYDTIKAIFEGEDGAEDAGAPKDDPPPRTSPRKAARVKLRGSVAKADPEPEPEEEEPEPPAKAAPAKKPAPAKAEPEAATAKSRAQELRERYGKK